MNRDTASVRTLPEALSKIIDARHHDPFEVLGKHSDGQQQVLRAYLPHCSDVRVTNTDIRLQRIEGTDLFEWYGDGGDIADRYQLSWTGSRRR